MDSQIPSTVADVINLLLPDFPSVAAITTATTRTPGLEPVRTARMNKIDLVSISRKWKSFWMILLASSLLKHGFATPFIPPNIDHKNKNV